MYAATSTIALALLRVIAVSANPVEKRDGGFLDSCDSWQLANDKQAGELLFASCQGKGVFSLYLNQCVENSGGQLIVSQTGGFDANCNDFVTSGSTLYATCDAGGGVYQSASIDLNAIVAWDSNQNQLFCDGHWGDGPLVASPLA